MCRILQGRDVCVLVPDSRGLERNFHDVTIVDMGDLPEVSGSMDDLSMLRRQWPATVLRHMVWLQQDLDMMRAEARKRFRNARPGKCSECHKWIKCDMYRHVATYHLDLAQLWRGPVSWCTVWKGTPQDCIDHVRGRMMYHGTLSRRVWRRLSPCGQFGARFGQIRWRPIIPGYQPTFSCLAISIFC